MYQPSTHRFHCSPHPAYFYSTTSVVLRTVGSMQNTRTGNSGDHPHLLSSLSYLESNNEDLIGSIFFIEIASYLCHPWWSGRVRPFLVYLNFSKQNLSLGRKKHLYKNACIYNNGIAMPNELELKLKI